MRKEITKEVLDELYAWSIGKSNISVDRKNQLLSDGLLEIKENAETKSLYYSLTDEVKALLKDKLDKYTSEILKEADRQMAEKKEKSKKETIIIILIFALVIIISTCYEFLGK